MLYCPTMRGVSLFLIVLFSGCALQREHTRRNFHFVRYRLMSAPLAMDCGTEGELRWCVYRANDASSRDAKATIYFLHYATGDEKSLARLGLANALYRSYRRARKPVPRFISVSYGTHWLFSNRPGKRQTVSTDKFLAKTLPALEKRLGRTEINFLWGMSQGGYNALELALAEPLRFRAAAASCPALLAVDPFTTDAKSFASRAGITESWASDGLALFNTRLKDDAAWQAEDPVARARTSALPPLLIQANLQDEFGFLEGSRALASAVKARGGSVVLQEETGSHCVNDVEKVGAFFQSIP